VDIAAIAVILHESHIFQDLDQGDLQPLLPHVRRVDLARGAHLWEEGDKAIALYVVVTGQLKTFRIGLSGGQIITQVAAPGDLFGHPGLFIPGERRGTHAEAMEPSVCLSVPRAPLIAFLHQHPRAMDRMLEALALMCWSVTGVLSDVTFQDIRARVARMLLALADTHGESTLAGVRIGMKLSQGTLAGLVGASRENVNRALAAFVANGDLRHDDGFFTLIAPDGLRAAVESAA
jgi:CRP/FNR family cyclic AMP-dependent transcriptional regulator